MDIHDACENGNVHLVRQLLESGAATLSFTTPTAGASCIQVDNVELYAASDHDCRCFYPSL